MVQETTPKVLDGYYLKVGHKQLLNYAAEESRQGKITNILVKGPQGCGKSTMPNQFAAVYNRPLATIEMGLFSEASQLFGSMVLENGQTHFKKGLVTNAITTPNCVVHIQEINRPESDKTLNAMFSVLDESQRRMYIDDADEYIEVAPGVTFFATLNEGYEFIGTMPLDEALEDRFALKMQLEYLPEAYEISLLIKRTGIDATKASNLVKVANSLRNNSQTPMHISTRSTIEMSKLVNYGIPVINAIKSVVSTDKDKLESILMSVHFSGGELDSENAGELEKYINFDAQRVSPEEALAVDRAYKKPPKRLVDQYLNTSVHTNDQDLLDATRRDIESDLSGKWVERNESKSSYAETFREVGYLDDYYPTDNEYTDGR